jgi:hypothetical protein
MISFEEEREFIYNICVPADEWDSIHSDLLGNADVAIWMEMLNEQG